MSFSFPRPLPSTDEHRDSQNPLPAPSVLISHSPATVGTPSSVLQYHSVSQTPDLGGQPTKVVHQAWGSLTAAGELQRCAFASRLSVLPGSHPAHNVSTMPGNKERALVSHAIAAMQSLYTLEKSICPTFVCDCPLLKTYCLIPVPFTTSRYFDPQQYLSVKGYFV